MKKVFAIMIILGFALNSNAAVMMSDAWGKAICAEWNKDQVLTTALSDWMDNNGNRGYKVMLLSRLNCPKSIPVQMTIVKEGEDVICQDASLKNLEPDHNYDYSLSAETEDWREMGRGKIGAIYAMTSGALKFQGPRWEAFKNRTAFGNFLLLIGKIEKETDAVSCP